MSVLRDAIRAPISGVSSTYRRVFGFHDNYWRSRLGYENKRSSHIASASHLAPSHIRPEPKEDQDQELAYLDEQPQEHSTQQLAENSYQNEYQDLSQWNK